MTRRYVVTERPGHSNLRDLRTVQNIKSCEDKRATSFCEHSRIIIRCSNHNPRATATYVALTLTKTSENVLNPNPIPHMPSNRRVRLIILSLPFSIHKRIQGHWPCIRAVWYSLANLTAFHQGQFQPWCFHSDSSTISKSTVSALRRCIVASHPR